MFVINIVFKKPLDEVEKHVAAHRAFLSEQYQKGLLLMSGPKHPRTGGIIIALGDDKQFVETLFADDPYLLNDLADYEFVQFTPVLYREEITSLVNTN